MLGTMISMMNNAVKPFVTQQVQPLRKTAQADNPFASTPFLEAQDRKLGFYGKNNPVPGGYFAGYMNGQPNIVGRKLFINA